MRDIKTMEESFDLLSKIRNAPEEIKKDKKLFSKMFGKRLIPFIKGSHELPNEMIEDFKNEITVIIKNFNINAVGQNDEFLVKKNYKVLTQKVGYKPEIPEKYL